ncbi:MAG: hypothetical protein IPH97_11970 [Ignavibacteriales bacterium]|nr:hypothetical protein [Ignavibacteriales bacterium]
MKIKLYAQIIAVLLALFVNFLWSTSFVIIKFGLKEIPPHTRATKLLNETRDSKDNLKGSLHI